MVGPPPDARRHGIGPLLWTILLGLDMGLLAFSLIVTALALVFPDQFPSPNLSGTPGAVRTLLWIQIAFNLLMLGAIPFAWVLGTRVKPWAGTLRYLRLQGAARGILQGIGWGLASLAGLVALGYLLKVVHYTPDNKQAEAILDAVTPALAVALALSAGIGEEIFFRGLLQKRLGVWGQAAVFGLFHLSYATPLQVIIPALLGLLYGWLIKRGSSLWVVITAHFLYDLAQLTARFWAPAGF